MINFMIKKKYFLYLSVAITLSNQAMSMENEDNKDRDNLINIGRKLSPEVSDKINKLIKVGGGLIEVNTIVKYHKKSILNENEKSTMENFFGNKNRLLPDNLGLIDNLWKTGRIQLNQFNIFSYTKESPGNLQAFLNRLYRFEDKKEEELLVRAYHIAIVQLTCDVIEKMKNVPHIYDSSILIDPIRKANIELLNVHGKYLKEEYPEEYSGEKPYTGVDKNMLKLEWKQINS